MFEFLTGTMPILLFVVGIVAVAWWLESRDAVKELSPDFPNPYRAEFERAAADAGVPASWASDLNLLNLIQGESAFQLDAKNPTSTAFGLFQFITTTWQVHLPEVPYGTADAYWQAVGGFRYIKARYGTPERAWSFWRATVYQQIELAPVDLQDVAQQWLNKNWKGY